MGKVAEAGHTDRQFPLKCVSTMIAPAEGMLEAEGGVRAELERDDGAGTVSGRRVKISSGVSGMSPGKQGEVGRLFPSQQKEQTTAQ